MWWLLLVIWELLGILAVLIPVTIGKLKGTYVPFPKEGRSSLIPAACFMVMVGGGLFFAMVMYQLRHIFSKSEEAPPSPPK